MSETWVLGHEHRDRVWRDSLGWTYEWDGDMFWNCYNPAGMHVDDLIEAALNENYEGRKYGPFVADDWTNHAPRTRHRQQRRD